MFLLAPPFVSDWLVQTLKQKQYPVIKNEVAANMLKDVKGLHWIEENEAVAILNNTPNCRIYSNSENALDWLIEALPEHPFTTYSRVFKDKAAFRSIVQDLFPNFYFQQVAAQELATLDLSKMTFPIILKPIKGFFSIGVHQINNEKQWEDTIKNLGLETEENIYPDSVLSKNDFLIEAYIHGKEYAVDCYFNNEGEAVITNILLHQFASEKDTSDRLYITSHDIIEQSLQPFTALLQQIGNKMGIKNYPLHIEVRMDENGVVIPIEVNPMRFGGWCTTADLSFYGHDFNAYEYVMEQKRPDWSNIFDGRKEETQSVIVLNNNSGYSRAQIASFDHEKLRKQFTNLRCLRKMDIQQWPVFGFVFTRTPKEKLTELDGILHSNLQEYLQLNTMLV